MNPLLELPRKLESFNLRAFLDCANELVRADEVERALWVLDNLPAYYRDFVPGEVIDLKNEILKRIGTPSSYKRNQSDLNVASDNFKTVEDSLRSRLIRTEVKLMNDEGLMPHIIDYGPGEYWLPIMLKHYGLKFTYQPIYLHDEAFKKALPLFRDAYLPSFDGKDRPVVYVACEIIEHLWNEEDILAEMLGNHGNCDVVHISTPKYTFDTSTFDWKTYRKDLGHLRAYTPSEFTAKVTEMFKWYHPMFYDHTIMHMRLTYAGTKFDSLKARAGMDLHAEFIKGAQ